MPKAIKSDARNIILKVKSFFEEEARQQAPIIPFNQIYKRVSAATVSYLCNILGIGMTWPSSTFTLFASANTTLNRPMTEVEISLFGSLSSIGALVGIPFAGYFMDKVGRKASCISAALSSTVAWTLIAAFDRVEVVLFSMFLGGLTTAMLLVVPIYIGEICQESIRGAMSAFAMVLYAVGMMISYLLGGYTEYHTMNYICAGLTIISMPMVMMMKESPVFLMQKGLEKEAKRSIAFYKRVKIDSKEMNHELEILRRTLDPEIDTPPPDEEKPFDPVHNQSMSKKKMSSWEFFKHSESTRKITYVTLVLVTASFFQGLIVLYVYAEPLFKEAVPNMSSTLCSVLLGLFTVIAGMMTGYFVETLGRKPLMVWTSFIGGFCCILLGTQLHLAWGPDIMTAVLIYVFCFVYNVGPGIIPYIYVAEVYLPEVRSIMSVISIEWCYICNVIILFAFPPLVNVIGLGPVFYIFAVICFLSAVFCHYYMPETKGLTVDVIQGMFVKKKRRNTAAYQ